MEVKGRDKTTQRNKERSNTVAQLKREKMEERKKKGKIKIEA